MKAHNKERMKALLLGLEFLEKLVEGSDREATAKIVDVICVLMRIRRELILIITDETDAVSDDSVLSLK